MEGRNTLHLSSRDEWRAWLATHHRTETEVWLVFYKRHTGLPHIPYDDAVEEALCFGWIDSLVRRIDDDRFARKFTPRRAGSRWSDPNRRRLRKVMSEGRMTAAGLATVDQAALGGDAEADDERATEIPGFIRKRLSADATVWRNFRDLPPSRRTAFIRWIMDARKAETRERRLEDVVARLEQNTGDPDDIPDFVKRALAANARAWENFRRLAPSYRRQYVGWIMHARKEETRQRRLREAVALLERNRRLGLK